MKALRLALPLVLTACPVAAQAASFADQVLVIATTCVEAKGGPEAEIAACEKARADALALRSRQASLAPHDENMVLVTRLLAATSIAAAQTKIDGARTARVCATLEEGWTAAVALRPEQSPSDWTSDMISMRDSAIPVLRWCRSTMGAPVGAPALPG
jgi:hypothetical protein